MYNAAPFQNYWVWQLWSAPGLLMPDPSHKSPGAMFPLYPLSDALDLGEIVKSFMRDTLIVGFVLPINFYAQGPTWS